MQGGFFCASANAPSSKWPLIWGDIDVRTFIRLQPAECCLDCFYSLPGAGLFSTSHAQLGGAVSIFESFPELQAALEAWEAADTVARPSCRGCVLT